MIKVGSRYSYIVTYDNMRQITTEAFIGDCPKCNVKETLMVRQITNEARKVIPQNILAMYTVCVYCMRNSDERI